MSFYCFRNSDGRAHSLIAKEVIANGERKSIIRESRKRNVLSQIFEPFRIANIDDCKKREL